MCVIAGYVIVAGLYSDLAILRLNCIKSFIGFYSFCLVSALKLQRFNKCSANYNDLSQSHFSANLRRKAEILCMIMSRSVVKWALQSVLHFYYGFLSRRHIPFFLQRCILPQGALLRDVWERCWGEYVSIIDRQGPAKTYQCQKLK